jgi:hypothetical protein
LREDPIDFANLNLSTVQTQIQANEAAKHAWRRLGFRKIKSGDQGLKNSELNDLMRDLPGANTFLGNKND